MKAMSPLFATRASQPAGRSSKHNYAPTVSALPGRPVSWQAGWLVGPARLDSTRLVARQKQLHRVACAQSPELRRSGSNWKADRVGATSGLGGSQSSPRTINQVATTQTRPAEQVGRHADCAALGTGLGAWRLRGALERSPRFASTRRQANGHPVSSSRHQASVARFRCHNGWQFLAEAKG